MSPMTLHTCLQGPLSGKKPHRDQGPLGSLPPAPPSRQKEPHTPGPFHEVPGKPASTTGWYLGRSPPTLGYQTPPGSHSAARREGDREDREGGRARMQRQKEQERGREEEQRELSTQYCKQSPRQFSSKDFILSVL